MGEQVELSTGQDDDFPAERHLATVEIDDQVAEGQSERPPPRSAADDTADPGGELARVERFDDVGPPATRPATDEIAYAHHGNFSYGAAAPSGPVYEKGVVTTGDPVYLRLVSRVDVPG